MRFNGKELAAVALQPSHKFDKEGVLMIKEKQDGIFRRGEVFTHRYCRLRGNMLFYFKTADQCSEPAGVFILEQCTVQVEGPVSFSLRFDGDKNVQQFVANVESERDLWIQALHMASYEYMRTQLRTLQEKLEGLLSKQNTTSSQARISRAKSLIDSSDEPFLEMSLACDNLMCDGNGTPPDPMLMISVITPPETQWLQYTQTEMMERSSNPCFLATVGFRNTDNISPATRVKISAHDVRERLTNTMTLIGSAIFTIGQLMEAEKNKLRLTLMSADNATVGFVTIAAWQIESEVASSSPRSSASNCESPQEEQVPERTRSLTLPVKLPCKSRISQHSNLGIVCDNAISQTYRFHTGLGADLSVHEIMAESKLSFTFPQLLLVLFIKEEKDHLSNVAALGELKDEWNTRQIDEIERHLQLINSYTEALTYLDSYKGPSFKASALKADSSLEFVPVNLHLQRMWVQNDSTKKCGFYDVQTVGAFAAHSLKYKNGGLLRLLSLVNASNANKVDNANKINTGANQSAQAAEATWKIKNLRQDLRDTVDRLNKLARHRAAGEMQVVMTDIANMAHQLTKVCEPNMIEDACRMLEEVRVPQNPATITQESNKGRESVSSSPLHNSSARSSPVRVVRSEPGSMEKDDSPSTPTPEEKMDSSKDWPAKRIQHRRSASDARLYTAHSFDSRDADRHSLFNVQISEEDQQHRKKDSRTEKLYVPSPSISRKLVSRLYRHNSTKEDSRSTRGSLGFIESNSVLNLLRKAGPKARHERSLINVNCSDGVADSNKVEEIEPLRKTKKSSSLRSLNGQRLRSRSPDEPEPWDLTQLNIEASVMCMASKVKTLCRRTNSNSGVGTAAAASGAELPTGSSSTPPLSQVDWLEELRPSTKKLRQALDCLLKTCRLAQGLFSLQEPNELAAQRCVIRYRRDVVLSQALTSVVAGITAKLWCQRPDPGFLAQLCEVGILIEFEGLLSCYSDEMGMLEDMVVAIDDLKHVSFKLVHGQSNGSLHPEVEGHRSAIVVNLPVPDLVLTFLPIDYRGSCTFSVTPVFFNVGVNEQATFAEKFGDTSLQDKINIDGAERIREFYDKYKNISVDSSKGQRSGVNTSQPSVEKLLEKLHQLVHIRRNKNVEILHTAAQICRQLGGLRYTSCKSAKDRTSMAVTLEQCLILQEHYYLAEHEFSHAMECMRCEGTRRENTLKNAGVKKYAFNSLQLMALPKLYRPPAGTYGNVQT